MTSALAHHADAPTAAQLSMALEVLRIHDITVVGGVPLDELVRLVTTTHSRLAAAAISLCALVAIAGENSEAQSRLYRLKEAEADANLREVQRLDGELAKARAQLAAFNATYELNKEPPR